MNHQLAKIVVAVAVALGILRMAAGGETNSTAVPYTLSTKEPSFFYADHLTGATYYKFDTNGTYVMIAKEHMGVWPLDGGKWIQASNGIVTMSSTKRTADSQKIKTVIPMTYKKRVFLVWPGKGYQADAQSVCRLIDSGTNALVVYNEFM